MPADLDPVHLGRMWLALWIIQCDSHSQLIAVRCSCVVLKAGMSKL
jgi:hypothetical protein